MANPTRRELLDQLKQIQLELYRSAANLDVAIIGIERELNSDSDEDMIKGYIRAEAEFRDVTVKAKDWDKLYKLEEAVWHQLH